MSKLQWFRLYHRIIDDEKIRLLAFEDRWHFIALCCLKADGLLDEPESSLRERKIAVKLGVQTRELDEVRRRLSEVGLIDENMHPVAWDALQYVSDTSTDRVRKHREKSKASVTKQERNVSVTSPDTDTDTDTEADAETEAAAAREKSDLDAISDKLIEAAGDKIQPHGAIVIGPILELIANGVDLETDVLPVIKARVARMSRPAGSWAYFVDAIREAYATRIEAGRGLAKPQAAAVKREADMTEDERRIRLGKFLNMARGSGIWFTWLNGPPPGREGCRVPADMLEPRDLTREWIEEHNREAA